MEKILLVEDDHCTRELIEEILTEEGYSLCSVPNGLAAKEILKSQKFALLITDFKMPGLNGVELLQWCRKQNISSKIIFMSGAAQEECLGLKEPEATFFPKPLNLDLFLKTIRESLKQTHTLSVTCN